MGTVKAPVQPEGLRADAAAFPALPHHYHGPVCINATAPLASVLQTHLHRYHSPVGIAPPDPSVSSCQVPAWGAPGGALGTPSPSLPSSVPQGAVGAREWVAGGTAAADGRWGRITASHAMRDTCVPRGDRLQDLVVNWCLQGPGRRLFILGMAASVAAWWLWLKEGWDEAGTEPTASSCSQHGGVQEDAREGAVLPGLLSPPELPKKIIYVCICVREGDRGAESPSESDQGDGQGPGSSLQLSIQHGRDISHCATECLGFAAAALCPVTGSSAHPAPVSGPP